MEAGGGWNGSNQDEVEEEWPKIEAAIGSEFPPKWQQLIDYSTGAATPRPLTSPRASSGGGAGKRGSGRGGSGGGAGGSAGPASRSASGALPAPLPAATPGSVDGLAAAMAAATAAAAAGGSAQPLNPNVVEMIRLFALGQAQVQAQAAAAAAGTTPAVFPAAVHNQQAPLGLGLRPAVAPSPGAPFGTAAAPPPAAAAAGPAPLSARPGVKPRRWVSMKGLCAGAPLRMTYAAAPDEHQHPPLPAREPGYTGPRPRPASSGGQLQAGAGAPGGLQAAAAAAGAGLKRGSDGVADALGDPKRQRSSGGGSAAGDATVGGSGGGAAPAPALPAGTAPDVAAMFNLMLTFGKSWGTSAQPDARDLTEALTAALGSGAAGGDAASALEAMTAVFQQQAVTLRPQQQQQQQQQQPALDGVLSQLFPTAPLQPSSPSARLPKLTKYYGCVSVVPALQPGEVRVLGVTAHSDLAAACMGAAARSPPTAQDPASLITAPPLVAEQLASTYSLRADALLADLRRQVGDASEEPGWAGLPADLRVRLGQGCVVGGTDRRTLLRGELALQATQVRPGLAGGVCFPGCLGWVSLATSVAFTEPAAKADLTPPTLPAPPRTHNRTSHPAR